MKIHWLCIAGMLAAAALAGEEPRSPDSEYHEGVPRGKIEKQTPWESKIYPGTKRDWWIYIPAQYDPATPANLMVFQDGGGPVSEKGEMRAPIVFDNLIHKKEMPVTIGVFVNPGTLAPSGPNQLPRQNRAFEYDSVGDRYARFLLEEILPEVEKKYKITADPAGRGICGQSSGGSCAFTVAWERPDQFGKVVSGIGSFTSLHGCNVYPDLIRKTEPKPIRIYMQDGDHDLDIYAGSWWHANMDMAAALRWSGYDYFFLQGHDGHSGKQLGQNFPDAMRWLWRNEPVAGKRPDKVDPRGIFEVLVKDEGWKKVIGDYRVISGGIASNDEGTIFFVARNSFGGSAIKVQKLLKNGEVTTFAMLPFYTNVLTFTSNNKLLVPSGPQLLLEDENGQLQIKIKFDEFITGVTSNYKDELYIFNRGKLLFIDKDYKQTVVNHPVQLPQRMIFTPDQGYVVGIQTDKWPITSARVEVDGSITNAETFYTLQAMEGQNESGARGLAFDDKGRLYVSSVNGIQVFDQGGRVIGILTNPERNPVLGMCFGDSEFDSLYAVTVKGLYSRKLNAKGVRSCKPPVTPPPPRM